MMRPVGASDNLTTESSQLSNLGCRVLTEAVDYKILPSKGAELVFVVVFFLGGGGGGGGGGCDQRFLHKSNPMVTFTES